MRIDPRLLFVAALATSLGGCVHTMQGIALDLKIGQNHRQKVVTRPEIRTFLTQVKYRISRDDDGVVQYVIELPNQLDDLGRRKTTLALLGCDMEREGDTVTVEETKTAGRSYYEVKCAEGEG